MDMGLAPRKRKVGPIWMIVLRQLVILYSPSLVFMVVSASGQRLGAPRPGQVLWFRSVPEKKDAALPNVGPKSAIHPNDMARLARFRPVFSFSLVFLLRVRYI